MSNAATRRHLSLVIDEDGVDSVWTTLREIDEAAEAAAAEEVRFEAEQVHADAILVDHLRDDVIANGSTTLILGKRWVDCYDPAYALVSAIVPECRIICEYDMYREEAEADRLARAAADQAAGLAGRIFGTRAVAA